MKWWLLLPLVLVVALGAAVGITFAVAGSPFDSEGPRSDESVAPVCAPEVRDCEDVIVNPDGDAAVNPDKPVSSGPITIIDDMDPNECNLVDNITACEEQATAAAIDDLAHNTGVDAATIAVRSVEFVEWPDACLGVHNPKLVCAQVITPGFRIGLVIGEGYYEYRTDATGSTLIGGK